MNKNYIFSRLQELGIYNEYFNRRELKVLASILNDGEELNSVITGIVDESRKLIVVTSYRIIIISSQILDKSHVTVILRKAVKRWSFTKRLLLSKVVIETEDESFIIKQTQGNQERLFTLAMNKEVVEFDE